MVDKAFEDFLDSDDDDFFLEASNSLLDCSLNLGFQQTTEKNASHIHSEINTKSKDKIISTEIQNSDSGTIQMSPRLCENVKNIESASKSPIISTTNVSDCSKLSVERYKDDVKCILNEPRSSLSSNSRAVSHNPQIVLEEHVTDTVTNIAATTSLEYNSSNVSYLNKTPLSCDSSSYINYRFTPGFTPKAKKRKFPGPAGLLNMINGSKEAETDSADEMLEMRVENISSQFTPVNLSSISWQRLQTAVSSCPNLHSLVKHYSIQRVLQESSNKKLPKHMVVPFLCVFLKKLNYKASTTTSVFLDDTGEIYGKIDAEIFSTYKEYLVEGTALILNKVTFLCNVLILKAENIVSVYHPDGTEKHPQDLESILKASEPLKPMNCECLKLAEYCVKDGKHKLISHSSISTNHNLGCLNHTPSRFNNISGQNKTSEVLHNNNTPKIHKSNVSYNQNKSDTVLSGNKSEDKSLVCLNSDRSPHITEASNIKSDAFLENFLDEDNCIDEFDELLGDLDEKSFMEDF